MAPAERHNKQSGLSNYPAKKHPRELEYSADLSPRGSRQHAWLRVLVIYFSNGGMLKLDLAVDHSFQFHARNC